MPLDVACIIDSPTDYSLPLRILIKSLLSLNPRHRPLSEDILNHKVLCDYRESLCDSNHSIDSNENNQNKQIMANLSKSSTFNTRRLSNVFKELEALQSELPHAASDNSLQSSLRTIKERHPKRSRKAKGKKGGPRLTLDANRRGNGKFELVHSKSANSMDLEDGSDPSAGPSPANAYGVRRAQSKGGKETYGKNVNKSRNNAVLRKVNDRKPRSLLNQNGNKGNNGNKGIQRNKGLKRKQAMSSNGGPKSQKEVQTDFKRKAKAERLQEEHRQKAEERKMKKEQRKKQQEAFRKMINQRKKEMRKGGSNSKEFEVQIISNGPPPPRQRQINPVRESVRNSRYSSSMEKSTNSNRNSKERKSIPVGKIDGNMEEMREEIRHSEAVGHEAEILRMQLENELGFDKFFAVYKQIKNDMANGSFEMQYLSMYLPSSKLRMGPKLMKLLLLEQAM